MEKQKPKTNKQTKTNPPKADKQYFNMKNYWQPLHTFTLEEIKESISEFDYKG